MRRSGAFGTLLRHKSNSSRVYLDGVRALAWLTAALPGSQRGPPLGLPALGAGRA